MNYSTTPEILVDPSLALDGMDNENLYFDACKTISDFTGLELSKLVYFVQKFGLITILDNPTLMVITEDQETLLNNLRNIILFGGDDENGTNVTSKSVRY
ncbi:MAG: hypothetical protein WA125_10185 [Desulfosporosinus sp.]